MFAGRDFSSPGFRMAGTTTKLPTDPATLAWNELAEKVDLLITAWQGDDIPPDLSRFLPSEPLSLRRLVLTELIKIDLEYRWQHHELPKLVEEYVEDFPELAEKGEVPCDLIYEEYHVRRQTDDPPESQLYYSRFPKQVEKLRRMMTLEPNHMTTTTLMAGKREADLDVGQQIDDFDLLVKLGKGSFGSVFLARQRSMQRLVALKISRDRGVEPQTLAQLDHPHIVRVYDQRVLADRKLQLMYMQHIPGGTLQDVMETAREHPPALRSGKIVIETIDRQLDRHGATPPTDSSTRRKLSTASWAEAVCWIGSKLAAALEYAHSRGVLHRDIKPANVLLAADGAPKLVDFNVSFSSKLEGATPAAYFGGSLAYMSPEQIEAYNPDHERGPGELDGRSDVYSLGIVLWELLTGARPFGEEHLEGSWSETLQKLIASRRAGLSETALKAIPPDWPLGLPQILASCLASDVGDRPPSAGQLARQLDLCLKPRVQRLLRPMPGSWRERFRRWPFWFFVILGLMPSAVFSMANLAFNKGQFIPDEGAQREFFEQVQVPVVNGFSFPIAVGLVVGFAWPVLVAVGRVGTGKPIGYDDLARLRHRALWVGDAAAWVSMALWVVSGFVFPVWQYMRFGDTSRVGLLPFLGSQVASGWISSTLTFFLLTFMFVRAFYPVLVRPEQSHGEEVKHLSRLEMRCSICFYLTIAAPFIALLLLIAFKSQQTTTQNGWTIALIVLGGVDILLAAKILQIIRADLAALAVAIDPNMESSTAMTDTSDTLWTSSR